MSYTEQILNDNDFLNEGITDFVTTKYRQLISGINGWKKDKEKTLKEYNLINEEKKRRMAKVAKKSIKKIIKYVKSGNVKSMTLEMKSVANDVRKYIVKEVYKTDFSNIPKSILQGLLLTLIVTLVIIFLQHFLVGLLVSVIQMYTPIAAGTILSGIVNTLTIIANLAIGFFIVPALEELGLYASIKGGYASTYTATSSVSETIRMSYGLLEDAYRNAANRSSNIIKSIYIFVINLIVRIINSVMYVVGEFLNYSGIAYMVTLIIHTVWNFVITGVLSKNQTPVQGQGIIEAVTQDVIKPMAKEEVQKYIEENIKKMTLSEIINNTGISGPELIKRLNKEGNFFTTVKILARGFTEDAITAAGGVVSLVTNYYTFMGKINKSIYDTFIKPIGEDAKKIVKDDIDGVINYLSSISPNITDTSLMRF